MTTYPKHIQEICAKIEAKEKAFGIINMATILNNQAANMDKNDFHPLHGLARF